MIMKVTENKFIRILVFYLSILQVTHLVVLIRAGIIMYQTGTMVFPASPPPGGWSSQALNLLFIMGAVDAMNAFASLVFVYAYFKRFTWSIMLGRIIFTIIILSAILYSIGIVFSGAFASHPIEYSVVGVAFAPVILLAVLFNLIGRK